MDAIPEGPHPLLMMAEAFNAAGGRRPQYQDFASERPR